MSHVSHMHNNDHYLVVRWVFYIKCIHKIAYSHHYNCSHAMFNLMNYNYNKIDVPTVTRVILDMDNHSCVNVTLIP